MANPLIGMKELATRWNVSTTTIFRMANDGIIKRAGRGKFKLADIEEYEHSQSRSKLITETFTERRLKQQLIAKDAEIAKLKQRLYQVASLVGSTMAELAEGNK